MRPRLTPGVIEALSEAQKKVLRIGMDYEMDPAFESEREREAGLRWGTMEELAAEVSAAAVEAVSRL